MNDQTKNIIVNMAIHNYIRKHARHDEEFDKIDNDDDHMPFVVGGLNYEDII